MKVLHINTYDHYGGAEKIAYTLYRSQPSAVLLVKKKLRYTDDPAIIEFAPTFTDKLVSLTDKVLWKLGFKKGLKVYFQASDEFNSTYRKLKKLKAYQEADIVHLHNIHGHYFDISALARIAKEKKVVWTLHDMWAMTGGEASTFESENHTHIEPTQSELLRHYPLNGPLIDRRDYFKKYKKKVYQQIAGKLFFVPVSHWLARAFLRSPLYVQSLNIAVIHNGIEESKFIDFQQRVWTLPRVLFFHSNSPFKGAEVFLATLKDITIPFELYVVGDRIKEALPVNIRVHYYARVEEEDQLVALFNKVDILVFPSKAESFGLLPGEAMLCGVFVIVSDAGGLRELVRDNVNGRQFVSGDHKDLKQKLEESLSNLDRVRAIGRSSRQFVCEQFSLKKMVVAYTDLYEQILSDNRSQASLESIDHKVHGE